jgi:hypothetical protein
MKKALAYNRRYHYARTQGIPVTPRPRLRGPQGRFEPGPVGSVIWELPDIAEEALTCCDIPGPALLCCGQWQKIETLPVVCQGCGRRWLEE